MNRCFAVVFLGLLVTAIAGMLHNKDLWFTDEVRVAGIAMQMADRQLYSVPYLGTEAFVEKPPVYFISVAMAYRWLGQPAEPVWSMRLVSLSWGLLTALACGALSYTLARNYSPRQRSRRSLLLLSLVSACILFSVPGFVKNALTLRVDIALAFFYMASLSSACRWIFTQRRRWLYLASLWLAFAFLSKGLIGPALVGLSLLALVPELLRLGVEHWRQHRWHYGAAVLVFLLPVGIWLLLMYRHGGVELLSFWLFDNQLARFAGGGTLGHDESGRLLYYLTPLAEYLGPWLLFFAAWSFAIVWRGVRRAQLPGEERVLWLFFLLPLLLLSAASTKRPVYMLPLLPICAAALALFFTRPGGAAAAPWARTVAIACVLIVMLLAALALPIIPVPASLWRYLDVLDTRLSSGLILAGPLLLWLIWRLRSAWKMLVLGVCYVMVLLCYSYYPSVNERHGEHRNLQAFVRQLDTGLLPQTAGRQLSEALSGYLYTYTRHSYEALSDAEVVAVLEGKHPRYRCVLYSGTVAAPLPRHRLLALMPENTQEDQLAWRCFGPR